MNPKSITVSTYTPGLTRANEADDAAVKENGFYFMAVTEDETYYNGMYQYVSDAWAPVEGDAANWPETSVNFYGVYFPGLTADDVDAENLTVSFAAENADKDFMLASALNKTLENNGQNVALNFQHLLANVEFRFMGAGDNYTFIVNSLSLSAPAGGIFSITEGSFTETAEASTFELANSAVEVHAQSEGDTVTTKIGENYMVLPAEQYEATISYTVTVGEKPITTVKNVENRKFFIDGIVAGSINSIRVKLAPGELPITVSTEVTTWGNNSIESVLD